MTAGGVRGMTSIGRWRHRLSVLGVVLCVAALSVASGVRADACDEPNDTPDKACPIAFNTSVTGTIGSATDVDAYKFDVAQPGTTVIVELTDLPQDYDLYLANARGGVLGQSVREGTGPERIQLTLAAGTYYVYVQVDASRYVETDAPYTLRLFLNSPPSTQAPKPVGDAPTPMPPDPLTALGLPPDVGAVVRELPLTDGRGMPPLSPSVCPTGNVVGEYVGEGFIYKVRGTCSDSPTSALIGRYVTGLMFTDGEIRLEFKFVNGASRSLFQVWFRDQGSGKDGYCAEIRPGSGSVNLCSFLAGTQRMIARRDDLGSLWEPDGWNSIAVRADGPHMWLILNDKVLLFAEAQTISAGAVAPQLIKIGNVNDGVEAAVVFRSIRVSRLANGDDARAPSFR
ncbi:MAG: pre-peptidase C-terminal domain-containing protein [Chloroflexota bacterium]